MKGITDTMDKTSNMDNTTKKVIFLDIDGTLAIPGETVPVPSALDVIRKARKKGHYVFLCTGRSYCLMSHFMEFGFDGAVASAGGYIFSGDQVIYDCPMTEEQKQKAMRVFKENGVFRTIECKDGAYTDTEFTDYILKHTKGNVSSEMLRWQKQLRDALGFRPMEEYPGAPAYKLILMSPSMKNLDLCRPTLEEEFQFCIQDITEHYVNCELINRKFNKGTAVHQVCEHLGIPIENSIGFGDSMNDKEMLETVGLGICMANGNEQIKQLADDVCPAVTEDGIQKAFLKYHLV